MEAFKILSVADLAAIFSKWPLFTISVIEHVPSFVFLWMLEVISVLEVINIVQLHILVCLPNIDDSHFDKMATILQEK